MATLSTLVDAVVTDGSDLMIASTTPALQMVLRRGRNLPIVFTLVANPMLAGAGESPTVHLPNVTGSYVGAPHAEMLTLLKQLLPKARRIGTLFVPAEINSVFFKEDLERAAKAAGYEFEAIGVSTGGEIPDAALALCQLGIDAFCQITDNQSGSAFASIAMAAQRSNVPLFSFASANAKSGALLALSTDFYDNGLESGRIAARVLRGEAPANIPFAKITKTTLVLNLPVAARFGIVFPPELVSRADEVLR
jgi:ABC-type uncharacterized transport system substrate-binding protein